MPSGPQPGYPQQGYLQPGHPSPDPHPQSFVPGGGSPGAPRRGGGRRVLLAFLVLFLLLSVGVNLLLLALMVGAAFSGDGGLIRTTVIDGDAGQKIVVVPLTGEIDERTARRVDRYFDHITPDAEVKAVVLEIDSPGGTVSASDEIYQRVLRHKSERAAKGLPGHVVVTMRARATSGGYYAACAGDHVFAEPTTLTGNIGVLMPRYNVSKLMEKYGVEESTVVSTGSTYKNVGSPFQPDDEKAGPYLQDLADSAMDQFKKVVEAGRGSRLSGSKSELYSGKVFVAAKARDLGLVDAIGYPRDAYAHAAKVASLSRPTVVRYQEPSPSLLSVLGGLASSRAAPVDGESSGSAAPVTVSVNGVEMKVGLESLDALRTPRLLYR